MGRGVQRLGSNLNTDAPKSFSARGSQAKNQNHITDVAHGSSKGKIARFQSRVSDVQQFPAKG
jgi:hypothetical protein